jgi:hypothetical protein|tara:strand:+ start:684 stop:1061 length:378 start_codon:yes stop_codon:yes gene_type:complete
MNKKDEIQRKIDDLNRQVEYNNQSNKRMLDQLNLLEAELMIIQRPQITEAEFERLVHDMSDLMSDILHDVSANVNDYTMDFEIGYNNEVSLSDISLDYDATDDIKNILETRFDIGPDQKTDEDTK